MSVFITSYQDASLRLSWFLLNDRLEKRGLNQGDGRAPGSDLIPNFNQVNVHNRCKEKNDQ